MVTRDFKSVKQVFGGGEECSEILENKKGEWKCTFYNTVLYTAIVSASFLSRVLIPHLHKTNIHSNA